MNYADIDAINWSTLKHLATSAKMLDWRVRHPRQDTRALRVGRAIHCAVLEPDRWATDYAAMPDFGDLRTKAGKAAKAEWLEDLAPGVEILDASEHAMAERCARSVREHPVAADLLRGGRAEETVVWTDEETGLACKGRIDYQRPDIIVDVKSTRRDTVRAMERDFADLMYHGQLGFYHMGAVASGRIPADAKPPHIVAVQTVEPFDVVPARLMQEDLDKGIALCRGLLHRYAEHRAAGWWPGLAPSLIELSLPAWAPGGEEETQENW